MGEKWNILAGEINHFQCLFVFFFFSCFFFLSATNVGFFQLKIANVVELGKVGGVTIIVGSGWSQKGESNLKVQFYQSLFHQ